MADDVIMVPCDELIERKIEPSRFVFASALQPQLSGQLGTYGLCHSPSTLTAEPEMESAYIAQGESVEATEQVK